MWQMKILMKEVRENDTFNEYLSDMRNGSNSKHEWDVMFDVLLENKQNSSVLTGFTSILYFSMYLCIYVSMYVCMCVCYHFFQQPLTSLIWNFTRIFFIMWERHLIILVPNGSIFKKNGLRIWFLSCHKVGRATGNILHWQLASYVWCVTLK